MTQVSIALGQMSGRIGDVDYNLRQAIEMAEQAKRGGADIICFPELFATGYNLQILEEDVNRLSILHYDSIVRELASASRQLELYIIAPFGIPGEQALFNGALLFDRAGQVAGRYLKTHSFYLEKKHFSNGDALPVFETDFGKIGILICYDIGFPETARELCLQGAEILFMPSSWRIQDERAWLLNVPSRALENLLFTVGVNRSGHEGDLVFCGKSMISNPFGEILMQMNQKEDGPALLCIDLDEVPAAREAVDYLKDRRPSLYKHSCFERD
jgi:predicted amidohydrolase